MIKEGHKVSGKEDRIFCPKWLKVSFSSISLFFGGESACFPCMTADSNPETFTVWMKSLIMQGNGLTVFNGNGQIVYRIDNYDEKSSREVFLMDLRGKLLFTLRQKRIWFLCDWEGYKDGGVNTEEIKPFFRVKRVLRFFSKKLRCDVKLCGGESRPSFGYRFEGIWGRTAFRILDSHGGLVAEAKRKQSLGVQLGEDVMSLVLVQTNLDHSLLMALVTVYLLIQHRI
ncbi:protein LURP-one-related 4-like isoform X1 [Cucurbita maxima]|uniref:Protein LURP-one-related 4-like isoform X1 n=1 Tax=Cucurbita maxima TaxID=3661 RepID=A0A6J1HXH3_CUCMA|nr:protein LURP-one-related 4-like isoform X1 [Cucurbita maxima]